MDSENKREKKVSIKSKNEARYYTVQDILPTTRTSQRNPSTHNHPRNHKRAPIPLHHRRSSSILLPRLLSTRSRTRGRRHRSGCVTLIVRQRDDSQVRDDFALAILDDLGDFCLCYLDDLPARRRGEAVLDQGLGARGSRGESEVGVEVLRLDEARGALRRCGGGFLRGQALERGDVEGCELLLEGVEVGEQGGGAVAVDGDEAVVGGLLGELVDHAAGEDGGHLGAVDGGDFGEDARVRHVAAVLAEEDGHAAAREVGHEDVVAGGGEGRVSAPRVAVEGEEIHARRVGVVAGRAALEIVPRIHQDVADVRCAVAHGDIASRVILDVVLEVASHSLRRLVLSMWV